MTVLRYVVVGGLIAVAIACGTKQDAVPALASASAAPEPGAGQESPELDVCAKRQIVMKPLRTTPPVPQADAEKAAGVIGVQGAPAIAAKVLVTIGYVEGAAPTPETTLLDAHHQPIADRPAWIFVHLGQHVPDPGGRRPGGSGSIPPVKTIGALASVVDANTGEFLAGWGCADDP